MYFFDYTIGCGWWMMVLYVLMLSAMFIIRGKPYSGENICTVLISPMANCIANILTSTLAFCWNVVSYGCIITNLKCFNVFLQNQTIAVTLKNTKFIDFLIDIAHWIDDFEYCFISIWKIRRNV